MILRLNYLIFYADLEATVLQVTGTGNVYIIKSGDTLSQIATKYGTSIEALSKANNITDPSKIRVGQKLIIPETSSQ